MNITRFGELSPEADKAVNELTNQAFELTKKLDAAKASGDASAITAAQNAVDKVQLQIDQVVDDYNSTNYAPQKSSMLPILAVGLAAYFMLK